MKIDINPQEIVALVNLLRNILTPTDTVAAAIKTDLERISLSMAREADQDGYLTKPIQPIDVCNLLAVHSSKMRRLFLPDDINMPKDGLKELGLYNIGVTLAEGVVANVKLWVVPPDRSGN